MVPSSRPVARHAAVAFLFLSQAALLMHAAAARGAEPDPLDWPFWRGPEANGISRETGLPDRWSADGDKENLLWTSTELAGRSTPIVLRGKLYSLVRHEPGTPREGEKVICVDAESGAKVWENTFNVFLSDVPDTRVGWSSVVGDPATGRVYALGVCGYFQCLDGDTGKTIWSHSLSEEYGLLSTYGGRTNFPIVFEDLVIISAVMTGWGDYAVPHHRFVAFDKTTGRAVWIAATRPRPDDTTYSTPVACVLAGQSAMVFGSGDGGIYAFQPRTGREIWSYRFSLRGINITPLVDGNTVYVCHSEENLDDNTMGSIAAIDGAGAGDVTSKTLWRTKQVLAGKSSPILVDGRLYVIDDGAGLFIYDARSGELVHKQKLGTMHRGSPLFADGKIYTCDATGRWYILKPTAKGVDVVHRLRLNSEVHASPIVSHGRLYLATLDNFYAIGKKGTKPQAAPRPAPAAEGAGSAGGPDTKPALLQVVPVEVLLGPGGTQQFEARAFNARGQPLAKMPVELTVDRGGTIDAAGLFTAATGSAHQAAIVTARAAGLTAAARVRIIPPLPWSFDFAAGEVPITWIGARYRHIVREVDGRKVMVKVTTIPKGQRSQAWMGPPDLHDYTVQADALGAIKDDKIPDIGVIAQRYTLALMGASQQLEIRTWPPVLQNGMAKSIPFAWKPNVWYTIKLRAATEGGGSAGRRAVLRGKVWERGKPEPAAWTIEHSYEAPNLGGSPGLFGNAQNAEIFLDNIRVYSNE